MEFNFEGPKGTLQITLALLVGLGAVGYGAYSYTAQTGALDSAETVEATIISTSIETIEERQSDDYTPRATFDYTYGGESYTSSNVYPGPMSPEFGTKEEARSQLAGYEPGDTVTAYVPTNDPGTAYLEHESSNKPIYVAGLGLVLVIGSVLSIFRGGLRG